MNRITETGYTPKSHQETSDDLQNLLKQNVDPDLNFDPADSIIGKMVADIATIQTDCELGAEEAANMHDPNFAEGNALDQIHNIVNVSRNGASFSVTSLKLMGEEGTKVEQGWTRTVDGTGERFKATITSFLPAAELQPLTITMLAESPGAVSAPAGSLVGGANLKGVTSVVHPANAIQGAEREGDAEYRKRKASQLKALGAGTIPAITEALKDATNVPGVIMAKVFENTGLFADANGVPGGAIWPFVVGGADQDIWDILFKKKGAGIKVHGSHSTNIIYEGENYPVGFERSNPIPIYVKIVITEAFKDYTDPDSFPVNENNVITQEGLDQVKNLIIEYGKTKDFGFDVWIQKAKAYYMAKMTGLNGSDFYISKTPIPDPPTAGEQVDITIAATEIAQFLDGDDGQATPTIYIQVEDATA